MTRINVISVSELSNAHLLAEHREIKRIPNVIKSGRYSLDGQSSEYTLGKGHVKFFYNKLGYLYNRYIQLYNECKKRGFNVSNYSESFKEPKATLFNGYLPTPIAKKINRERINIRTTQSELKKLIKTFITNH